MQSYEEFLRVQGELRNYDDLRCLREAKEAEKHAPTIGIDELKKRIGGRTRHLTGSPKKRASR